MDNAPQIAVKMSEAAHITQIGPMASVAAALAFEGVKKAEELGSKSTVIENGGDIVALLEQPLTVGIYAGKNKIGSNLAFVLEPGKKAVSLCSSSSFMGHSKSFGACDLATVFSFNPYVADAAATLVCNLIKHEQDIAPVLEQVGQLKYVTGILAVKNDKIGLYGTLPSIVKNNDTKTKHKITVDLNEINKLAFITKKS
jgi:ApbE superfamily uncharacterized protein (UPF0280 family)